MSQAIEYRYHPNNLNDSVPNFHSPENLKKEEMIINIGPQHPSTHGVLRLEVVTNGEIIVDVVPHLGYLHRCFEKHAENVAMNGVIPFVDRLDYVAAMNSEHAYAMGVEQMLGITERIPPRVEYIRVLMAELNRIASHFVAIGTYGLDIGAFTPFLWVMRDREHILRLLEWSSGARMLYNYIWIGGLMYDVPIGFEEKCAELIQYLGPKLAELDEVLMNNKIFIDRTANIGVIPRNLAINYGVTGPILRASGLRLDYRKVDGYSVYPSLDFEIPIGTGARGSTGDCWDRTWVRIEEIKESVKIISQCLEQLTGDHKRTRDFDPRAIVPKKIRPKAQDLYVRAENPKGELGFFFRTDGRSDIAVRCKARGPSFSNLSILPAIAKGNMIADLVAIIGSLDFVMGEVDR